jgi:hypothetical protein
MNKYPEVLEPLLFYLLHRANAEERILREAICEVRPSIRQVVEIQQLQEI